MYTDPIADMLTRIRNAGSAEHAGCAMPNSKLKSELARVMKEQGYIDDYQVTDGVGAGTLEVTLRYHRGSHVVTGIRRESKPGQRKYVKSDSIPVILNGFGIAILSTSKGVMTGKDAANAGVGGEVICSIW